MTRAVQPEVIRLTVPNASIPEDPAPGVEPRPRSVTSGLTAGAGFFAANTSIACLWGSEWPVTAKMLAVVVMTAAAMMVVEVRQGSLLLPRPGSARGPLFSLACLNRLFRKAIALASIILGVAFLYAIFPEYSAAFYGRFWEMLRLAAPVLAIAVPFYLIYVDAGQADPEDAYAQLGALLTAQSVPHEWDSVRNLLLGWLVKAFFLPIMAVYLCGNLEALWATEWAQLTTMKGVWDSSYNYLFLIDLLWAVVGYSCTLRLLGTEIRSVESTVGGWVTCLVCYQPFVGLLGSAYLASESDHFYWGNLTEPYPVLCALWGGTILVLTAIYVWATVSFGLRFSNLTNRGIITSGPYRWTKHPAYITKCISFWLISIPFLSTQGWWAAVSQSVLLAAGNAIYYARAKTEERHLSKEPAYRDYAAYIAKHGLLARIAKFVTRRWSRTDFAADFHRR
ncbi:MAG: isoprenylcysteine carboxylmethyltransferase family protein [Alsobacter sp.]